MSRGAIAGAAVGGVVAVIILLALVWVALAYRKKHRPPPPPPKIHHQMADDYGDKKMPEIYRYEVEGSFLGTEISTSARGHGRDEKSQWRKSELNDGHGAFEMDAHSPIELEGDGSGKKRDSKGMSNLLDDVDRARITRMANWKLG